MNQERIKPSDLLEMARQVRLKAAVTRRESRTQAARASDVAALAGETLYRCRVATWRPGYSLGDGQ